MSDVKALFGLFDKKNKRRLIGAVSAASCLFCAASCPIWAFGAL